MHMSRRDHTGATGPNPYFWPNAEMLEMAEDAYDRSSTQQNRDIVAALVNGFIERFGTDWSVFLLCIAVALCYLHVK